MEIKVSVTGIEGLIKNITKLVAIVDDNLKEAITTSALIVEGDAKKKCPVDTGRLRASITHSGISKSPLGEYTTRVGTDIEYAPDVEFPTRRHLARVGVWAKRHGFGKTEYLWVGGKGKEQPFLYPAFNENFNRIKEIITNAVKEVIK